MEANAMAKAIPEGMHTVTPVITVKGCAEALEFWKKAFGAEETTRALDPSGKKIWHAAFRLGDSTVFCSDEFPEMGAMARTSNLWLYMDRVDAAFKRATDAGCKVTMPVADMFWGDRFGNVVDPWGNQWGMAQHIKDLTPEEAKKAEQEFIASQAKK
jgi:PhnB protein